MPATSSFLNRVGQIRMMLSEGSMSGYQVLRESLRILIPYSLRRHSVNLIRRFMGTPLIRGLFLRRLARQDLKPLLKSFRKGDFYETVTLLPHIPESEVEGILAQPVRRPLEALEDIVCFSPVDWSFRFQRPQQLMARFAAAGHRVFYISVSGFMPPGMRPSFSARRIRENLYEISIAARRAIDVLSEPVSGADLGTAIDSLDELRAAFGISDAVSYAMIPSWFPVVAEARARWDWRIVYDCMDDWDTFPGIGDSVRALERSLAAEADLVVVTAGRLLDKLRELNPSTMLARNAADFEFFRAGCGPNDLLRSARHPVVGYFGAIADWFDIELMAGVARLRPDYTFLLLGGVFDVDVSPLLALPNVRLPGQQPYETMPLYLHHFDACVIPFRINRVTEATDPVKVYEYLSGGKPVISVRLPELGPYAGLIYFADSAEEFAGEIDRALREDSPDKRGERIAVASSNTWEDRRRAIHSALREASGRASIVIVTYNNLALTRLCLESVLRNTACPDFEVIVVDNASSDGTGDFLARLAAEEPRLRIVLNRENYGFARANNQGLELATGDRLVLLNNDTVVPPGWLGRLLAHLEDPDVGMAGPVTNFVGNEAKIAVTYRTWAEMESFSLEYCRRNDWMAADIHMLAMFCVAFRRDVYEKTGPLDEQFGIGMFEDDDYSIRVRRLGYRLICASDCFVHHFGQAAFGKLIRDGRYDSLFNENRALFEKKWEVKWTPHQNVPLDFARHRPARVEQQTRPQSPE